MFVFKVWRLVRKSVTVSIGLLGFATSGLSRLWRIFFVAIMSFGSTSRRRREPGLVETWIRVSYDATDWCFRGGKL